MANSDVLFRNIEEIPLPYRSIFSEYPCFNAVQSKVLDDILYTDHSVVISSPTGSGKTVIFELAIVRLLLLCENLEISQDLKIVYISPIKSLCQERLVDWHRKFSPFGLNCASFTGDSDNVDFSQLTNHDLIISTPEKWDSLTRKWRDNEKIVKVVKLFLIDEVHLLNEENRGSTLEVIVSRMKTVEKSVVLNEDDGNIYNQKIRFIALSATVPNVEDIAEWLGKPPNIKYHRFSEEMRPVKLKRIVLGYNYNPKTTPFRFDISLNYKLQSLMMQYSEGKPTLIFCSTRKSVEMTANHIVQTLRIMLNEEQREKLSAVADIITDSKAKATIKHGIGYHHAGMITETRHAIENLFRRGDLPVLVTTSTLAMGVNLPAHLVIIKSTKCYDNGGFRDYTETAVHQMIGRAGRPQFDTSATALILTTNEDKPKFEKMVGCTQPIESNLHRHLIEHLNAEVVLRTITDLDVALQWLASTFLYVRARKNPRHYGLNVGLSKEQIDKKLLDMCQIDLNKLVKAGMLTMDQNIVITPTTTGQIMAKFYIAFETMKLFTQISGTEILIQILGLISRCQEFSEIRLRVNDKKTLNLLNKNSNKNTIRFTLNGKIKTWDMKVNCIIQAVLGNLDISDHAILSESFQIMRNGVRIAKCLIEYLETRKTNCYSALLNTTILCKCLQAKLWENSPYVCKQLSGIGSVTSHQLVNVGKTTFRAILESNPRDLEMVIKKKNPVGNTIIEEVEHIPFYEMTLEKVNNGKQLKLSVKLINAEDIRQKSTVNVNSLMTLIVGNDLNEILVYVKYRHSYMLENSTLEKFIDINPQYSQVNAHFISNDWVGIDCNSSVTYENCNKKQQKAAMVQEKKEGPTYIQMFLDMYMKTKKKDTKEKSKPAAKKVESKVKTLQKCSKELSAKETNNKSKKGKGTQPSEIITDITDENMECGNVTVKPDKVESQRPIEETNREIDEIEINQETSRIAEKNPENDDVFNESSSSLFSNGLSSAAFADHMNKVFEEAEEQMQKNEARLESEKENPSENEEEQKAVDEIEVDVEEETKEAESRAVIDFNDKMSKDPTVFRIAQKYVTDGYATNADAVKIGRQRNGQKRKDDFHVAMIFEGPKEDAKKRQKLAEFKFPNKRKFTHRPDQENMPDSTQDKKFYAITEILEPPRDQRSIFQKDEPEHVVESKAGKISENAQKNITWRSPLVFSPAMKFSPKLSFHSGSFRDDVEADVQNETTNETFETSTSSKGTANVPLNVQRTPRRNRNNITIISRSRGTVFPLCDRDYADEGASDQNKTQEISKDDPFDICSTSFLETLGVPRVNQNKSTPSRLKSNEKSPAANYYTKLISNPVYSQKESDKLKELEDKGKNNENRFEELNSSQKSAMQSPKVRDNKKNESFSDLPYQKRPNRDEYDEPPTREPQDFDSRSPKFILSQNRPLTYENINHPQADLNRSLNYSVNTKFSDLRPLNTVPCQNFMSRNESLIWPYNPQIYSSYPQNIIENPGHNCLYRQRLNETITSNSYLNQSTCNCFQQHCHLPRKYPNLNFSRPPCTYNYDSQLVDSLRDVEAADFENDPYDLVGQNLNRDPRSRRVDSLRDVEAADFENDPYDLVGQNLNRDPRSRRNLERDDLTYKNLVQKDLNRTQTCVRQDNFVPRQRNFGYENNSLEYPPHSFRNRELIQKCPDNGRMKAQNFDSALLQSRTTDDGRMDREISTRPVARSFEDQLNESMVGRVNSLFEEPYLENASFLEKQESDRFSRGQRADMNYSFVATDQGYQKWDCCDYRQVPNFNRSFVAPQRRHCPQNYFPPQDRDYDVFPSSNDKGYVMNKFLRSLSQE